MIQGLAIACSICKFTFPYDYTRKYSQLLAQRKQRETLLPSLPLSTHNTHIESPHTGAFLECVASLLSCPAEWGRRDWEPEASSSGNGKAAKAGKRGEQGRAGKGVRVLAAIDAEKFTFLAHCDCAWDTVKCLHCSACLQGGVSNTRRGGNADWDLLRLVICILPSQKTSACGAGRMCLPTTHKHRDGDRIYYIVSYSKAWNGA